MSKHTPGPWIFENRNGDHPLNDQDGWGCDGLWAVNGGFILGSGTGWDGAYQGPIEANARLIAAAPEMYELLANLAAVCDSWDEDYENDEQRANAFWHMGRIAKVLLLAKIEGGGE